MRVAFYSHTDEKSNWFKLMTGNNPLNNLCVSCCRRRCFRRSEIVFLGWKESWYLLDTIHMWHFYFYHLCSSLYVSLPDRLWPHTDSITGSVLKGSAANYVRVQIISTLVRGKIRVVHNTKGRDVATASVKRHFTAKINKNHMQVTKLGIYFILE